MRIPQKVALMAAGVVIGGLLSAVPANGVVIKPTVTGFTSSSATLYKTGGTITLSAAVANAATCVISSNKAVAGMPYTATPCNGVVTHDVALPANSGKHAVKYTFKFVAHGATTTAAKPAVIVTVSTTAPPIAIAVSAGARSTCAILYAGTVDCWGVGVVPPSSSACGGFCQPTPVPIVGLAGRASAIATGGGFSCALIVGGTVECWGGNNQGQLGNPAYPNSATPVTVVSTTGLAGTELTGVTAISAGPASVCALITGGGVDCWGNNSYGQLGTGPISFPFPVAISGLAGPVTAIAAGSRHSCAIVSGSSSGIVQCWGDNELGELGIGNNVPPSSTVPVAVVSTTGVAGSKLTGATAISTGDFHTCALIAGGVGGTVDCWGDNSTGELGDGYGSPGVPSMIPFPVVVNQLTGATSVAAGGGHTCADITGGSVDCWGANSLGELGDGKDASNGVSYQYSGTPVSVVGLSGASDVSSGGGLVGGGPTEEQTCAVAALGAVQCWGANSSGQLGIGTVTNDSPLAHSATGL